MKNSQAGKKNSLVDLTSGHQAAGTLFITCSDTDVSHTVLQQIKPNAAFIIQNPGNVIPPYHAQLDYSEIAGIEFALLLKGIHTIIICGHSHCHILNRCLHKDTTDLPHHLDKWMTQINDQIPYHPNTSANDAAKQNVLNQMQNIKKYPVVQEKMINDALKIHAWFFNSETNEISEWQKAANKFVAI